MAGKLAARVRGLSEAAFRAQFGREEQCRTVLFKLRWPTGFVCPACGHQGATLLAKRQLHQCQRCRHQASLLAGTIFHSTKLPLTQWFLAMYLLANAKNGISSLELGRRLGVKQPTAWAMKQKLMQVMLEREARKPLDGRVELDDAYLGGSRPGRRGRGAGGKTPFVAAVATTPERRPRKIKLLPIRRFGKAEVATFAQSHLAPGSTVVSDGLTCWSGVEQAACTHVAMVTGSGRRAAQWSPFKWVNTALGNIKAALAGTYRKLAAKHAGRYLASFAWRYNRRFDLATMLTRLAHSAVRTKPHPYRMLVAG